MLLTLHQGQEAPLLCKPGKTGEREDSREGIHSLTALDQSKHFPYLLNRCFSRTRHETDIGNTAGHDSCDPFGGCLHIAYSLVGKRWQMVQV